MINESYINLRKHLVTREDSSIDQWLSDLSSGEYQFHIAKLFMHNLVSDENNLVFLYNESKEEIEK